jgi:hypothetical protein
MTGPLARLRGRVTGAAAVVGLACILAFAATYAVIAACGPGDGGPGDSHTAAKVALTRAGGDPRQPGDRDADTRPWWDVRPGRSAEDDDRHGAISGSPQGTGGGRKAPGPQPSTGGNAPSTPEPQPSLAPPPVQPSGNPPQQAAAAPVAVEPVTAPPVTVAPAPAPPPTPAPAATQTPTGGVAGIVNAPTPASIPPPPPPTIEIGQAVTPIVPGRASASVSIAAEVSVVVVACLVAGLFGSRLLSRRR